MRSVQDNVDYFNTISQQNKPKGSKEKKIGKKSSPAKKPVRPVKSDRRSS